VKKDTTPCRTKNNRREKSEISEALGCFKQPGASDIAEGGKLRLQLFLRDRKDTFL
jgi:hypothetical protein